MRARVRWGELRRQGAARRKTDQAEGVEPVEGTDRGAAAGVPLLPVIWGPVLQEDVQSCLSPGKSAFLPHEPGREGGGGRCVRLLSLCRALFTREEGRDVPERGGAYTEASTVQWHGSLGGGLLVPKT